MVQPAVALDSLQAPPARTRAKSGVWAQSTATKKAVLDAARQSFAERGYEASTINDIVRSSGVSVGSIYHQIGGKAEVFTALADMHLAAYGAAAQNGSRKAKASGENDPVERYLARARAYLLEVWKDRTIARVIFSDDVPSGFAEQRRSAQIKFLDSERGFVIGKPPSPSESAVAVLYLLHAAILQLVDVDTAARAVKLADFYLGLIRRLAHAESADS